jgi:hypothetical protein
MVDASSAGDTVFVAEGTYAERISIKDGVHVFGGYTAGTKNRTIHSSILEGEGMSTYMIVKYSPAPVNPTVIDGFKVQNAQHTMEGGGAYIRANITLNNMYFYNCKGSNGGGVMINGAGTVSNSIIELCSATSSGGAFRNTGGVVENCIIRGNGGKYGGAGRTTGVVRNCVIYNNEANVSGWPDSGGLYVESGGSVINCIIANNFGNQYAAIHSEFPVINTVIWGNKQPAGVTLDAAYIGGASGSHSNMADSGTTPAKDLGVLNTLNTHGDGPNFKSPTVFAGIPKNEDEVNAMRLADWSYSSNSRLINVGSNADAPAKDILGVARPQGTKVDLGAYEYDPNAGIVAVTGVSFTNNKLEIYEGDSVYIAPVIAPVNASNKAVTWAISNTSFATIDEYGLVKGLAIGSTTITVTTVDGGFTATLPVYVLERPIPVYHPLVAHADTLDMSLYTVPSYTLMIIAREAARHDSTEVKLEALQTAIDNMIDGRMPYNVTATINGDPKSRMGIAWYTNAGVTEGVLQIVEKKDASVEDFDTPTHTFEASIKLINNTNYNVYENKLPMPNNSKRSYVNHKALATGLKANTAYSYRVGFEGAWSEIQYFETAPANASEPFNFLYFTDPQSVDMAYMLEAKKGGDSMAKNHPDAKFVLTTGDLAETGTAWNSEWEYEQFFETSFKEITKKFPWVPTDGNHDDTPNRNYTYHFNADTLFNATAKSKAQLAGTNYSFVYGDVLFIMISFQDYWRTGYMDSFIPWFKEQIRNNPDTKWRIVGVHKPLYTGSGHQPDADSKLFRDKMLPVYQEYPIDIMIQGHDHVYNVIGPVDNVTRKVVPNSVSGVQSVTVNTNTNMTGKEGGVFDVSNGPLYFSNGTIGLKRYYPYTKAKMEEGFSKHGIEDYWDLFTGKFGQAGKPTYSDVRVDGDTIRFTTYAADNADSRTIYDDFKVFRKGTRPVITPEDPITGVEVGSRETLHVYPNPSTDRVSTNITNIKKVVAVDLAGRQTELVFNNQEISVASLAEGLYVLKIATDKKVEHVKFVKSK